MEKKDPSPEKAIDRQFADYLMGHIENPCEVEVEPGVIKNIRDFWLRLAKEQVLKMTDSEAIKDLEDKIKQYEV